MVLKGYQIFISTLGMVLVSYICQPAHAQTTVSKDSLELYKLDGPVKQVLYSMYEATLVEDSFSLGVRLNSNFWPSELTFNTSGYRLKRSSCDIYGQECRHWVNKYDDSNRLISRLNIEKDVVIWEKKEYTYSNTDKLKTFTQYYRESDGLKLDHRLEITQDSFGRTTLEQKFDESDIFKRKYVYEYDNGMANWSSNKQVDDEGMVEKSETRTFDSKGRIIQRIQMVDGALLEKQVFSYTSDSLSSSETFSQVDGTLELSNGKYTYYGRNDCSILTKERIGNMLKPVRYIWESRNSNNQKHKQRCKNDILTSENIYNYDSDDRVVKKQRFDFEDETETIITYCYLESGQLASELTFDSSYGETLVKWYYDEFGNWTYMMVHKNGTNGLTNTIVHQRSFKYFEE